VPSDFVTIVSGKTQKFPKLEIISETGKKIAWPSLGYEGARELNRAREHVPSQPPPAQSKLPKKSEIPMPQVNKSEGGSAGRDEGGRKDGRRGRE
jgi:hypothetical protein